MTTADRLARIRVKIERAKKHIAELEAVEQSFFSVVRQPNVLGVKRDPKTGDHTYYVKAMPDVPLEISAIAGDALQNLRTSLDHLACHLVEANASAITRDTSFPMFKGTAIDESIFEGKVKGMRQEAKDAIRVLAPYKGGNDLLWMLHYLNNIDKHRLLLIVGCTNVHRSITPSERTWAEVIFRGSYGNTKPFPYPKGRPLMVAFDRGQRLFPLKAGDVLFTIPESETEDHMDIQIDIAFGEPKIVQGEPILATLHQTTKLIEDIVTIFTPYL